MPLFGKQHRNWLEIWRVRLRVALLFVAILVLVGLLVEMAFYVGCYLDARILTDQILAAALAEFHPRQEGPAEVLAPGEGAPQDLFAQVSWLLAPPSVAGDSSGLRSGLTLDMSRDDVVITMRIFDRQGKAYAFPAQESYWAYSNHDQHPSMDNWAANCGKGQPLSDTRVALGLTDGTHPVVDEWTTMQGARIQVDLFYCYEQVVRLPLIRSLLPVETMIHVRAWEEVPLNVSLGWMDGERLAGIE